ncbi:MAG: Rpn family recombination-promoting nuclease/putative transposase [Muribaculaceae bacterium]|nr:Rpn family recombination-promoting nuclease/putative transposase [Muribaculaceae bacterium]
MSKQIPPITTTFINLQSDFEFKRAFGTKKFQNNVINLLNAALGDEIDIKRIVPYKGLSNENSEDSVLYHNKEIIPGDEDGKRIIYDVYFTLKLHKDSSIFKPHHIMKEKRNENVEHHFILEMQNVYTPPFEDRMTYYVAKMLSNQGRVGWNYDLDPVVLMAITDFDFPYLSPQMTQEFELREKTTGESLTKKLRMIFYSLNQVPEDWDSCKSELQKRLYIIKNIEKMGTDSKPYLDGGYDDLFESAASNNVVGEDAVLYSQSLAYLREVQAGLDYRFDEGIKEGREQERLEMAQKMKDAGTSSDFIAQITGLSIDIINKI